MTGWLGSLGWLGWLKICSGNRLLGVSRGTGRADHKLQLFRTPCKNPLGKPSQGINRTGNVKACLKIKDGRIDIERDGQLEKASMDENGWTDGLAFERGHEKASIEIK